VRCLHGGDVRADPHPLGRIANAVRDNPERAEFIGYNTQRVRWLMLILSSFFAGIAGGLTAINFEIVSAENVSAVRSGGVLLAAFIGGASFFFGPILGAIVFIFFSWRCPSTRRPGSSTSACSRDARDVRAGRPRQPPADEPAVMKFGKFKRLRDRTSASS